MYVNCLESIENEKPTEGEVKKKKEEQEEKRDEGNWLNFSFLLLRAVKVGYL